MSNSRFWFNSILHNDIIPFQECFNTGRFNVLYSTRLDKCSLLLFAMKLQYDSIVSILLHVPHQSDLEICPKTIATLLKKDEWLKIISDRQPPSKITA